MHTVYSQWNCLHIAAYAYQDVHVWSALLTCVRPLVRGDRPIMKQETVLPPPPPAVCAFPHTVCGPAKWTPCF